MSSCRPGKRGKAVHEGIPAAVETQHGDKEDMPVAQSPQAAVLALLRQARLRPTPQRIAVLKILLGEPDRWFSAEALIRQLMGSDIVMSVGSVYRIVAEMVPAGLLIREATVGGRRHYRLRPGDRLTIHQIVCRQTGLAYPILDERLRDSLNRVLRDHDMVLSDTPIILQVDCKPLSARAMGRNARNPERDA